MKNRNLLIYRIITGLFSLMMLFSASMYFFNYEMVAATFTNLNFPTYLIYPLAIAKILGLVAIWTRRSSMLKEWAYAGYAFDFMIAFSAHIAANDGEFAGALIAMALLIASYVFDRKAYGAVEATPSTELKPAAV